MKERTITHEEEEGDGGETIGKSHTWFGGQEATGMAWYGTK